MDKYEFSIKVEQIKEMVNKGDYETAIRTTDIIDWWRVHNVNILSMMATIYEKDQEYQETKDILLLASKRTPIGRRLLLKLAELAIEEGSIGEAEDYYREFYDLAPDDPRQYILEYMILGAKDTPVEQLIHTLERYCNIGLDEKWLYELAGLYAEAGMGELCIMVYDKTMFMFGLGKYVKGAVELKTQFAPLTKYQMDLAENRDKYEAKLRAMEKEYRMGAPVEKYNDTPAADSHRDHYGTQSASYAREAAATREPGYEEEGDYVQKSGYTEESDYGQGSSYGRDADYGQESDYAQEPGYVREPDCLQEPGYTQESEYPRATEDSRQGSYDNGYEGEFGSGGGYGEESVYTEEPGYAEEPEYVKEQGYAGEQKYAEEPECTERSAYAPGSGYGHGRYSQEYSEYSHDGYSQYADGRLMEEGPPCTQVTIEPEDGEEETAATEEISEKPCGNEAAEESFKGRLQESGARQKESTDDQWMSDEALKTRIREAGVQASLAIEMSRISDNGFKREIEAAWTRVFSDIRDIKGGAVREARRLMIEARTPQQGLEKAIEALKEIHRETGARNQATKITGERFNSKGAFNSSDKLTGKDLMIEQAGDMAEAALQELNRLMTRDETSVSVVLIDTAERLVVPHRVYLGLAKRFEYIGKNQPPKEDEYETPEEGRRPVRQVQVHRQGTPKKKKEEPVRAIPQEPLERPAQEEMQPVAQTIKEQVPAREKKKQSMMKAMGPTKKPVRREVPVAPAPVKRLVEPELTDNEELSMDEVEGEEMDIDEFAKYTCECASDVDCGISGKSMLALYERIEITGGDGIALTKGSAEDLIEETADGAENPSFFKRITGILSSKHDEDGLLILKEERFV